VSTMSLSEIIDYLESIRAYIDGATISSLDALKDKVRKNYFNLAILGQQKRGKSTLVNAILGQAVLPMAVTPATSVITVVEYGPEPLVTVVHENGLRREITVEQLADYITEEKNPNNEKQVAVAHIAYPSQLLARGIRLVDTPGVGSIFEHNTKTAYGFLPHIDAALFVFSVDTPVAVEEIKYLRDVREQVPMIYFVLNKTDFYQEEDVKRVLAFTRNVLEKELEESVEVYPLSALMALEAHLARDAQKLEESGFTMLEKAVLNYFYTHRDQLMEMTWRNKLGNILVQVATSLQVERQALDMPVEELRGKIASYTEFLRIVDREIRDVSVLLEDEVARILQDLDERFEKDRHELERTLASMLADWYQQNRGLKTKFFVKAIEQKALDNLTSVLERWRRESDMHVAREFEGAQHRFMSRLDDIVSRILGKACEMFGIAYTGERFRVDVRRKSEVYYKVGLDPLMLEISPRTFSGLLPRRLLNRMIWQCMAKDIPQDVDRNYGRIRYDFLNRLRESVRALKSLLEEETERAKQAVRSSLQQAMEIKAKGEQDIGLRKVEIDRHIQKVNDYLTEVKRAALAK